MGSIDKQYKCQTCNCDIINCTGHHGCIQLKYPVYNVHYMKIIFKLLQCICIMCSNILLKNIKSHNINYILENIKKIVNVNTVVIYSQNGLSISENYKL